MCAPWATFSFRRGWSQGRPCVTVCTLLPSAGHWAKATPGPCPWQDVLRFPALPIRDTTTGQTGFLVDFSSQICFTLTAVHWIHETWEGTKRTAVSWTLAYGGFHKHNKGKSMQWHRVPGVQRHCGCYYDMNMTAPLRTYTCSYPEQLWLWQSLEDNQGKLRGVKSIKQKNSQQSVIFLHLEKHHHLPPLGKDKGTGE